MYMAEDATTSNLQRALYWFDLASAKLPDAERKAIRARQTLADAAFKKQRAELEAKVPESLDATCPNCGELLDISSVKCLNCSAIFSTSGANWRPIPIAGQTSTASSAHLGLATASETKPAGTSTVKLGQSNQSTNYDVKKFARIALWTAHFCLVVSILSIGLDYLDSGFARLIAVAPLFYLVWAVLAIVSSITGRGRLSK